MSDYKFEMIDGNWNEWLSEAVCLNLKINFHYKLLKIITYLSFTSPFFQVHYAKLDKSKSNNRF